MFLAETRRSDSRENVIDCRIPVPFTSFTVLRIHASRLVDPHNGKRKRKSIVKEDKDRLVLVSYAARLVSEKELRIILILYNMILFCAGANVRTNEINRLYDNLLFNTRSWLFKDSIILATLIWQCFKLNDTIGFVLVHFLTKFRGFVFLYIYLNKFVKVKL